MDYLTELYQIDERHEFFNVSSINHRVVCVYGGLNISCYLDIIILTKKLSLSCMYKNEYIRLDVFFRYETYFSIRVA